MDAYIILEEVKEEGREPHLQFGIEAWAKSLDDAKKMLLSCIKTYSLDIFKMTWYGNTSVCLKSPTVASHYWVVKLEEWKEASDECAQTQAQPGP